MRTKFKTYMGEFFKKFVNCRTTTLASSLAFYTSFSLAPLLVLFVSLSAYFSPALEADFLGQVTSLVGPDAAQTFALIIKNAKERPDLSSISGIIAVATLGFSAALIFGELRSALNHIYGIKEKPLEGISAWMKLKFFLKERLFHMGLAFGFIFTLMVSLVISAVLNSALGENANTFTVAMNMLLSYALYTGLFTLLFRFMPLDHQPWKLAAKTGAFTSVLFLIGKELIGFYLGNSAMGSAYGAAGSVVVLLVWVYYSSVIVLVGAELTLVYNHDKRKSLALHNPLAVP